MLEDMSDDRFDLKRLQDGYDLNENGRFIIFY